MNKIKFALKNLAIVALIISSFIACDKDFASVGSDVIGQGNYLTNSTKEYPVIAYTNPLAPVQTNNLPLNYLGAFNDLTYGLTTASFVSQLGTTTYDPDFGDGVILDSVILTVPYFSRAVDVDDEGGKIYELDSIFGNGFVDLEIYENNYFLNSINPNEEFDTPLNYFSNSTTSIGNINPTLLMGTEILPAVPQSLNSFRPSNREIVLKDEDGEISSRTAPALRVKLDNAYWLNKIIEKEGDIELSNANNFNNYFRGIFFKVTPLANSGSLALLNFNTSSANITLHYTKNPTTTGADRAKATFVLTFTGNRINLIENQFDFAIPPGNPVDGDEKLYLKGAEGSTAVIDLFKAGDHENGFSPEFYSFKNDFVETDVDGKFVRSKRLINEANLVFYVNHDQPLGTEPDRIYLYDLKNGTPLSDYFFDFTNNTSPVNSKINHLGVLEREGNNASGEGIKYKIKITEHINNLLLRDSTNVKLGLSVSGNVNLENSSPQYKVLTSNDDPVNKIPVSSIISPRGTILYGNNTSNEQKKLYLEIFYTEPNN